jgi:hypothetical protein
MKISDAAGALLLLLSAYMELERQSLKRAAEAIASNSEGKRLPLHVAAVIHFLPGERHGN